jgi:hypothetical protein
MPLGRGTVFNAATCNWGNTLGDPVVDRVTRNVLDRLSAPPPADRWEVIGPVSEVRAIAAWGGQLFAAGAGGTLLARELCGQNLPWRLVDTACDAISLAIPREAVSECGLGLYGLAPDGRILYRDPVTTPASWRHVCQGPPDAVAIAACDEGLFCATADGVLWRMAFLRPGEWEPAGDASGITAMTGMNGRLYGLTAAGALVTRLPVTAPGSGWSPLGAAPGCTTLAASAGRLVAASPGSPLLWRDLTPDPA